jgi:translation initiation factor 2 beta subunit (eIF-2beta)/eIF-5
MVSTTPTEEQAGSREEGPRSQIDRPGSDTLSPLEQEILDEYARLLGNMNNVGLL